MQRLGMVALRHVERLSAGIGPRVLGTLANEAAAAYVHQMFREQGLATRIQEFALPSWEDLGARLILDGVLLPVGTNTFSPPCDVIAPTCAFGTMAELTAADLAGCVGVMYGELCQIALSSRGAPTHPDLPSRRDGGRLLDQLEAKQPAALITVSPSAGRQQRLVLDHELSLPSASVSPEVGLALLRHAGCTVHLQIAARRTAGEVRNVVATVPGHPAAVSGESRDSAGEPTLVVCAHLDTMPDSPGAFDNASGVAVLLSLAGALREHRLGTRLDLAVLNGQEYWSVGAWEYLRRHQEANGSVENIIAALNVDGVGQAVGTNVLAVDAGPPGLEADVAAAARAYPGVAWTDPWPQGDHSAFAARGVPVVLAGSHGAALSVMHTPDDTSRWLSQAKLAEAIRLVRDVVLALHEKRAAWYHAAA